MATTLPRLTPSPSRSPAGSLSRREREVFELLAQGLKGAEIAHRLLISPATVRIHVRNGMQHLGARTPAHAVALAVKTGEIEL